MAKQHEGVRYLDSYSDLNGLGQGQQYSDIAMAREALEAARVIPNRVYEIASVNGYFYVRQTDESFREESLRLLRHEEQSHRRMATEAWKEECLVPSLRFARRASAESSR